MVIEKCYVIYDCPSWNNDKQWLTDGLIRNGIKVEEIVPRKVLSRILIDKGNRGMVEVLISIIHLCLRALRKSSKDDVIICWSPLAGVITNTFSELIRQPRKIISMNWLAPANRKSRIYVLKRKLFTNPNAYITVNSKLSAKKFCEYFSIPFSDENNFIFLPDVFDEREPFVEPLDNRKKEGYIFAGGMGNRDWKKIVELAYALPQVRFVCVALENDWISKVQDYPDNVEVHFGLPSVKYYKLMKGAGLICLPLIEERPSGLINIIKSAQFGIPCITNNYEVTAQYYGEDNKDLLINDNIEHWKNKIRELWEMEETKYLKKAGNFQNYIKTEFSPDRSIEQLVKVLKF